MNRLLPWQRKLLDTGSKVILQGARAWGKSYGILSAADEMCRRLPGYEFVDVCPNPHAHFEMMISHILKDLPEFSTVNRVTHFEILYGNGSRMIFISSAKGLRGYHPHWLNVDTGGLPPPDIPAHDKLTVVLGEDWEVVTASTAEGLCYEPEPQAEVE